MTPDDLADRREAVRGMRREIDLAIIERRTPHARWHAFEGFFRNAVGYHRDFDAWGQQATFVLLPMMQRNADADWRELAEEVVELLAAASLMDDTPRYGCPDCA